MPAKDFKFISPGVFINEIDNSQLPQAPGMVGPAIIGRAQQGPGLIPTTVNSFQEFVQKFGTPVAGATNDDVFRNGNTVGPTYAAYAAQAWLRNNSPITFVRLVGKEDDNAVTTGAENDGAAGWQTAGTDPTTTSAMGGAYGLFVIQSSSAGGALPTGNLAAIWYVNSGSIALSGTWFKDNDDGSGGELVTTSELTASTNKWFPSTAAGTWKAVVRSNDAVQLETEFNFDMSSENFIRKVFNTNPILTNTDVTVAAAQEKYWLGESFEDEVNNILTDSDGDNQYAFIAPLDSGSANAGNMRRDYSDPKTGWFISQDLTSDTATYDAGNMQKLFRLVARNTGRWASKNIKVSIGDIRAPSDDFNSYGTFSVIIRAMNDTDNRPKILEQFNNCNLNPQSENYVARKIGNKYLEWQNDDRRWKEFGDYPNLSDYVYVDMDTTVDKADTDPAYLPFGVWGQPVFNSFADNADPGAVRSLVTGGLDFYSIGNSEGAQVGWAADTSMVSGGIGATLEFPRLRLRVSASEGNPTDPRDVYFGVDTTFDRNGRDSRTIGAYTGAKPAAYGATFNYTAGDSDELTTSWIFSLDDICNTDQVTGEQNELTGTNVYVSGSRKAGAPADLNYVNSDSWRNVLDIGADQFTTVLHGAFDGLNIKESEPFRNSQWDTTTNNRNSYTFNSMNIAIDSLRDPEAVQFDLAAMPGITNNVLNRSLVDACETRGDALAVIDLQNGYVPTTENASDLSARMGSVASTINNARTTLQINSSFGCAYYPWVQIQDTLNNAIVWVPPSVAALGAMSYGQRTQELWFAPAGFTRGGLSANNAAGIPVVGVRERLISKDRDKLYEANINPIAQFPAEGIVIFGQKTLQMTPSALDRINVRRLMIFLKRQISAAAATLLFDQNVQTTWNRFRGAVNPMLADVKSRLGLEDYKLILDETTTTPDLIDRNIMYAQVFLKPARSIEFIAIDFVITDSGASFED